jgi:hypothetical protein
MVYGAVIAETINIQLGALVDFTVVGHGKQLSAPPSPKIGVSGAETIPYDGPVLVNGCQRGRTEHR